MDDGTSVDTESDAEMDVADGSEVVEGFDTEESPDAFWRQIRTQSRMLWWRTMLQKRQTLEPVSSA